jgi:hypothetical protein
MATYMRIVEHFQAHGHRNITARNRRTFEFTKDKDLSLNGDCIVAVASQKGALDLSQSFRELVQRSDSRITIKFKLGHFQVVVEGSGSPKLSLKHPTDLVIRKSNFICDRTLIIRADKAAVDFPLIVVEAMRNPMQIAEIELIAEV